MKYACLIFVPKDQQAQDAIRFLEKFGKCGQASKHQTWRGLIWNPKIQPKSSFTWAGIYLEDFWGSQIFFSRYELRCFFCIWKTVVATLISIKQTLQNQGFPVAQRHPNVFQDYRFFWTFPRGAISRSRPESSGQVPVPGVLRIRFGKSVGFWEGGFFSIPTGSMGLVIFAYILPSKSTIHVGKYTSPMDPMGMLIVTIVSPCKSVYFTYLREVHNLFNPLILSHPSDSGSRSVCFLRQGSLDGTQ